MSTDLCTVHGHRLTVLRQWVIHSCTVWVIDKLGHRQLNGVGHRRLNGVGHRQTIDG